MGRQDYWDEYIPARPIPVRNGIKAKSQRGDIGGTWWSRRWISVLESFHLGARLARGRSYARRGQVVSVEVQKGKVTARVQGTRPQPYSVEIRSNPLSDSDWDKVAEVMASQAIFAAKLLSGEMPRNIEEAFSQAKTSLFPSSGKELHTDCSCPDWANPCKHVAAVYYLLAESFDADPFLIFTLRGRTKEEIILTLRERRATVMAKEGTAGMVEPAAGDRVPPLEECLETFWQMGEAWHTFTVKPALPEVDNAILKRLGNAPFTVGKDNITSLLSKAYQVASAAAWRKATGEEE